jgi:hypothetical protein
MSRYRLLEIRDKLINNGNPFYRIEKKNWFGFWTEYFEEHTENGCTFYNREEADVWYNYHINPESRIKTKIIAQN